MKKVESFFLGIIIASGALIFELIISIINPAIIALDSPTVPIMAILIIAIIEEFFKLTVIWKTSQKYKLGFDIFINSVFIGVGFSAIEIGFNIFSTSNFCYTILFSYLGLALIHTTTSAIFGYYFSLKKDFSYLKIIFVLLLTIFIHLFYNLAVDYSFNPLISYTPLIFILFLLTFSTFRKNKRII